MKFFIGRERRFDVVSYALFANEPLQTFSTLPQFARVSFQHFAGNVRRIRRAANPRFHRIVGRFSLADSFS